MICGLQLYRAAFPDRLAGMIEDLPRGVKAAQGIDYAWDHPSIQSLVNWGAAFVCRYVSPDAKKNETLEEATRLAARGIWSVLVYESSAARATAGKAAGAADANRALTLARKMHMPEDRPIYFAVDFDLQDLSSIKGYFEGVKSVLGLRRTGVYGGYKAVQYLHGHDLASWVWQTYAWSGGHWYSPSHIQQYHNDIRVGGVGVDANRATVTDYGQWMPGKSPVSPKPVVVRSEMFGGELNLGAGAETMIALPKGVYGTIGFNCDNERPGKPPAKLRVAIWSGNWDVSHVVVDGTKGQTVVTFPDKANASGISILRDAGDAGDVAVGFEVS